MSSMQKKVCLLGDFAVGKTSLIRRFVEGNFQDKYLSTIGTKVNRKTITLEREGHTTDLTLLIWDLAGGEKFSPMMRTYYRGAAGALLVCDVTRPETLATVTRYATDFWSVSPNTPLVFVGNKIDLVEQRTISDEAIATLARDHQAAWFTSSAKTGDNVETLFQTLGQDILAATASKL